MISVLCVDDEEELCAISSVFLTRKGFSVTTCQSGKEALDLLSKTSFDVIVSDYQMPAMNGIELLSEVRKRYGEIPFVLFTGKINDDVVIHAIEQNADYYIRKDYDPPAVFTDLAFTIEKAFERYKIEKNLHDSEEKYRFLVTHALEPILIVDLQGNLIFANNAAGKMIEVKDITDILGRNVMEFISPESREEVLRDFSEVAGGHDSYVAEYEVLTASGRPITLESIGKLIQYENKPAILLSLRDITDRKQIEKALRKASRQINLMNSITRHDILNKVTILLGALEIAEMECNDPAILYYFNVLNEATKAIQKQIEFTRLYQDLGIQEPAWLSPASIIREMRVPEGLTLDLALEEIVIFADPMLEKVFHNLLDNSIRHGETVSHIRVSGAKASGGYVIAWEDNGIGIRDDEKETIFKRGHGKNTGLGLFLAREILALTGITITETGTEGKGARFEIMIPNWFYSDADGTGTDTGTKLH